MAFSHRNDLAKTLRQLHQPGNPIIFTNCYDAATAAAVVAHPSTRAIASASYAIAAKDGIADEDLSLASNLRSVAQIAKVADSASSSTTTSRRLLPMTADLQDGYDNVADSISRVIEAGAVGCNLEDVDNATGQLRSLDDAVARVRAALDAAKAQGVPDFVVNARTDTLYLGGDIDDAIRRGKAYLAAGAVTCYVWGGPHGRGVSSEEIRRLVGGLGGMINVKMNLRPGFLTAKELAQLGVARISVGPELFHKAMAGFRDAVDQALLT